MSNTPVQEPPGQDLSSGSGQTLPSRPIQTVSDPSASKRVCFYKSGDYTFSGHRMVINARTFKTFDALLDALSKKVPLPFGVRTITTPRGTHLVRALEDLHDGGSYVCSDQKRVKPLNLDEVNRRQVPWNTTRPYSAGRRLRLHPGKRQVAANRPAKVTERVAVRTPKKLEVINNRDPAIKRTIVLQRRTAPTFDALLDYLSQILQFPVLKLFSTDGRRVDGLATLILCSGVVVAAGNEPFRLGNYNFHRTGPMTQAVYMETVEPSMLQANTKNNKSLSSGRGSRNFSLSSERYIVDQINKSRNGSMNSQPNHHRPPFGTKAKHRHLSMETCGTEMVVSEDRALIVPHEDDIEKSFRVNEDGSMTVEMKVHLTIKEEEVLHWTTTVSRSCLSTRTAQASISESGNSSPDSNNQFAKDSPSLSQDEMKEENHPASAGKAVGFNDVQAYDGYSSTAVAKRKIGFKRTPTPGPRHVNKKASVESVKTVTETGVHESTVGHYSYVERTADGETTEGYCVVRHSSSSSSRPVPKPRKTASAGANKTGSRSSERSSGVAEVLQIESNGMEVTETVMHIYENEGCYDNYYANEEYSADSAPLQGSVPAAGSKASTVSDLRSTNSDCDIDFSTTDSLQRQKEEMLSLSSEPLNPLHEVTNSLPSVAENKAGTTSNSQTQRAVKTVVPKSERKKRTTTPRNQKGSSSTGSLGQKQREKAPSDKSKHSSTDKLGSSKKSLGSPESAKSGLKSIGAQRAQMKKVSKGEKMTNKEESSLANIKPVARRNILSQRQNLNKAAAKDHGHSLNTSNTRPQVKKNMQDTLQTKIPLMPSKRTISKPKSVIENKTLQPKEDSGLPESFSMPSLNPSPSEVHEYVEKWLEKVSPDTVPYAEDAATGESESRTKVVFQIGDDSGSDEKNGANERFPSPGDAVKKSTSSLSVPLCHAGAATAMQHGDQFLRGLCVSMPSVRVDPSHQENRLRSHRSAEAIGPAEDASASSNSNVLGSKERMKPVMQHLCSSVQCIQRASDTNTATNLEKAKSLPDFSMQVASVFGSSCRAFLSFLSVMTLRDNLSGVETKSTSEAQIMMESLQKISTIGDEEEQRSSLTDLQSRASSQFRERWKDFQILRERLQSEPLSPRVSETEFALDVVSEGGDVFEDRHSVIDELMEELNMPQDLREEISSTIQHAKCFYPVDESTFVETERNQSDSEEDVEKFVDECEHEPHAVRPNEDATETEKNNEDGERGEDRETGTDVTEISQTERDEPLQEREEEEEEEQTVSKDEDGETNGINDKDGEETEEGEREEKGEEGAPTEADCRQEKWTAKTESEKEKSEGGEESDIGEKEVAEEAEEGSIDEEDDKNKKDGSTEETDEREGAGETEEEERGHGEEEDEENEEEGEREGGKWVGVTTEADEATEDRDEGEEEEVDENIAESLTENAEEEEEAEEMTEVTEEKDEGEIAENVTEEVEEDAAGSVSEEQDEEEVNEEDSDEAVEEKDEEEEKTEVASDESNQEEDEREVEREQEEVESVESVEIKEEREESVIESEEDEETESDKKVEEDDGCSEGKGSRTEEEETDGEIIVSAKEERRDEEECEGSDESNREEDEREERKREQEEAESVEIKEEKEESATESEEDEEPECDKKVEEEDGCSEGKGSRTEEEETDGEITVSAKEERRDEEEFGGSEDNKSVVSSEGLDQATGQGSTEEAEDSRSASDDADDAEIDDKHLAEKSTDSDTQSSLEMQADVDINLLENDAESLTKKSSEGQCEDDKGNGTDCVTEAETDEGGEHCDGTSGSFPHPAEISQELLDFVNSALQSSSLVFTYDSHGNVRLEPDNVRVVQTKQPVVPERRRNSSYGLKRLPSPITSDLSDYRPETSESGGYKSQDTVDVLTESGEDSQEKPFPVCRSKTRIPNGGINAERSNSQLSVASNLENLQDPRLKSEGSFSSFDSGNKASREDLSYFSAGSSQRTDVGPGTGTGQRTSSASKKDSPDGVLIDRGRWLLKENHLIRRSPPLALGMYGNADSTSLDTSQENTGEDSPPHYKTQHNPLAAISSSELEEMAKPLTPKCTYYNMPHGSDSDPFLDDGSLKSGGKDASSTKCRGFRVSPTIDTTKTWASKNGSLSSFTSVEFKIPDRKVHPEGESSAVPQARRTSSGGEQALQAPDSWDTLQMRCSQYCPIL